MENVNLIDTFSEFKELKNIDRPTMMSVLEDVFRGMLAKRFGSADNFDIIYYQIKNLRKKLQQSNAEIEIEAVYGIGYKLIEK